MLPGKRDFYRFCLARRSASHVNKEFRKQFQNIRSAFFTGYKNKILHVPYLYIYDSQLNRTECLARFARSPIHDSQLNRPESVSLASLANKYTSYITTIQVHTTIQIQVHHNHSSSYYYTNTSTSQPFKFILQYKYKYITTIQVHTTIQIQVHHNHSSSLHRNVAAPATSSTNQTCCGEPLLFHHILLSAYSPPFEVRKSRPPNPPPYQQHTRR